MTTAKKVIQVASKYIGVSGTDNIFNTWYWGFHCYDENTYPWCAAFVSYVLNEAGLKCSFSASASGVATQFERIPVAKEHTVKQGDIVVFNWDGNTSTSWCHHVGIVEWSTIGEDGLFGTIEGNTTNTPGGKVARVTRNNESSYFTAFFRPKYDSETQAAPAAQATGKTLYGIDVSSNQPKGIVAAVKNDFAIVKMSGNPQGYAWDYVNPYAGQQCSDGMKKHGKVGLYHFTYGKDAITEADFFVEQVKNLGLLGKAMLVIDYEADAVTLGRAWVNKLANRIKSKSCQEPVIYASGSVIVAQKLFELGWPIWCANYSKGYEAIDGYSTKGCAIYPGCEKAILWQYTSQGYLSGYNGPLDCNTFTGGDWSKYAGKGSKPVETTTTTAELPKPRYRIKRDGKWTKWRENGQTIGIRNKPFTDVEFENLGDGGWFQLTLQGGKVLGRNKHNNGTKKVIGLTVLYKTPNPSETGYYDAYYRVLTTAGKWLKWERDDQDGGAGDDAHALCAFQLKLAKSK